MNWAAGGPHNTRMLMAACGKSSQKQHFKGFFTPQYWIGGRSLCHIALTLSPMCKSQVFSNLCLVHRLRTTSILCIVEKWGGFYMGLHEILGVASHKFQELNSCSVTSDCGDVGCRRLYSWLNVTKGNDLNPMSFLLWTKTLYLISFHFSSLRPNVKNIVIHALSRPGPLCEASWLGKVIEMKINP